MGIEIHAWVEITPVNRYPPTHNHPVIAYTEAGNIYIARYKAPSKEWIDHHSLALILEPVTHWANTHKISRAIQDDLEDEEEDE